MTNGHEARRLRSRAAILASAATLFEEHGFAETTVAEIAAAAGVSQRTLYLHFPMKEDLLFAHVDDFRDIAVRAASAADLASAKERVGAGMNAMIDAVLADRRLLGQALERAGAAQRGQLPRSLAAQIIELITGLTGAVAASSSHPPEEVAPMVGAAVGAVQAAGLASAARGAGTRALRDAMLSALDRSLEGFEDGTTAP